MNYLIAINSSQSNFSAENIHKAITGSQFISDWWHYLPDLYIVTSIKNSKAIADMITSQLPGMLFFVAKIDLHDVNGILAKGAWDWISKKNNTVFKLKSAQSVNLSSLSQFLPNIPQTQPKPPLTLSELLGLPKIK